MLRGKRNSIRTNVGNLFHEYCANSSVHGVRYLSCRERTACEKFWWLLVFLLSIGSCSLLIRKIYHKWDQTPVIVSFDEKSTRIWQIPFPAVTLCPQTKAGQSWLNFSREHIENMVGEDVIPDHNMTDYFIAMVQMCERTFYHVLHNSEMLPNKTSSDSFATLIDDMSIPMKETIHFCFFRGRIVDCEALFRKTITEDGICFTFNGLSNEQLLRPETVFLKEDFPLSEIRNASDWTLEHGYSAQSDLSSYPYRTVASGYSSGLAMNLITNNRNYDYLCGGPVQGLKVLLHSPADYPQVSKKFIRVPLNQEVTIAVKPQMIVTAETLRNYAPERRQCFFDHERYLRFFQVYTQDNCELECLTNFTFRYCGCVKFSMPHSNRTAICESNKIDCMILAENELLEMDAVKHRKGEWNYRADCNCLPSCTSVQYDAEITQTDFDWMKWSVSYGMSLKGSEGVHISRLGIYYKEAQFMASKRSELYGLTDFLANCGGLLGLCMGVSLLSLVELVYFCSVRPFVLGRNTKEMSSKAENDTPAISLLSTAVGIKDGF
ncbi:pickpocket protein 28-like [Malaya genurostris]|uniref:pickpocket protein 28-like n=1 Tax=Malaya genurostris TaxID=325434 RepID=UPI0026F3D8B5|nr:pickpocket protein 28-like [Malaya genurostris]